MVTVCGGGVEFLFFSFFLPTFLSWDTTHYGWATDARYGYADYLVIVMEVSFPLFSLGVRLFFLFGWEFFTPDVKKKKKAFWVEQCCGFF